MEFQLLIQEERKYFERIQEIHKGTLVPYEIADGYHIIMSGIYREGFFITQITAPIGSFDRVFT